MLLLPYHCLFAFSFSHHFILDDFFRRQKIPFRPSVRSSNQITPRGSSSNSSGFSHHLFHPSILNVCVGLCGFAQGIELAQTFRVCACLSIEQHKVGRSGRWKKFVVRTNMGRYKGRQKERFFYSIELSGIDRLCA